MFKRAKNELKPAKPKAVLSAPNEDNEEDVYSCEAPYGLHASRSSSADTVSDASAAEGSDAASGETDESSIAGEEQAAAKRTPFPGRAAKRKMRSAQYKAEKKRRNDHSPDDNDGGEGEEDPEDDGVLDDDTVSDDSTTGRWNSDGEEISNESEGEDEDEDEDVEVSDDEGYGELASNEAFVCKFCPEKILESKAQHEAHLRGKRHLNRVKEAEENPEGHQVYRCSACPKKEMRTEKDVEAHLISARHLRNAKRFAASQRPPLSEEQRQKRIAKNMTRKEKRIAEKKRKTKELLKEKKKRAWLRSQAENSNLEKS